MNLDELANKVLSGIKEDWPTIYKIRYIYLELGKYLSKDTDFFFSCDNKLFELNMNYNEIKSTYESLTGKDYKVICRSACEILKYVLKKAGIKSRLVKQINKPIVVNIDENEQIIDHYFLAVEDGNNTYFMTLASDLPFIKEGMKTRLFANDIPYKKRTANGKEEQIYEGDEIHNSTISSSELEIIDKEIGYIKNYYNYDDEGHKRNDYYLQYNDAIFLMLKDELRGNKLYYYIEGMKTYFYKSLYKFKGIDGKIISFDESNFNNISEDNINLWIKNLCILITNKLKEIHKYEINYDFNNFNYNEWLKNICKIYQNNILLQLNNDLYSDLFNKYYIKDDFDFHNWSKNIKKEFKRNTSFDYDSIITILDKTNALVNYTKNKTGDFNSLFNRLSYHFIKRQYIISDEEQKSNINNTYIAHKFKTLFNYIFRCNHEIDDFNNRNYSEQIVIIKEIIETMFPELNYNNSNIKDYNKKYSATQNRIHAYPIKKFSDGSYSIVFNIVGDNKLGDYYFFYDPKKNYFCSADILDIYNNYMIVSERFKNRLEEVEEINIKR